jgi:phosphoribosyl 1,2-cyclic phosphate phosphodiesterase
VETPQANFVIDSGPDFRYQMLRAKVKKLDAIVFTHGHKDHVAGLDDIRPYNYFQQKDMQVYATEETQVVLKREFSYIFENITYPGIPQIQLNTISAGKPFAINGLEIIPIRLLHYHLEVLGFRIGDFTYITDASYIALEEIEKVMGCSAITLNALRHEPHISHFTFLQALEMAVNIGAGTTYFTHISHQLGLHDALEAELPNNIRLAYDGLVLEF